MVAGEACRIKRGIFVCFDLKKYFFALSCVLLLVNLEVQVNVFGGL